MYSVSPQNNRRAQIQQSARQISKREIVPGDRRIQLGFALLSLPRWEALKFFFARAKAAFISSSCSSRNEIFSQRR